MNGSEKENDKIQLNNKNRVRNIILYVALLS